MASPGRNDHVRVTRGGPCLSRTQRSQIIRRDRTVCASVGRRVRACRTCGKMFHEGSRQGPQSSQTREVHALRAQRIKYCFVRFVVLACCLCEKLFGPRRPHGPSAAALTVRQAGSRHRPNRNAAGLAPRVCLLPRTKLRMLGSPCGGSNALCPCQDALLTLRRQGDTPLPQRWCRGSGGDQRVEDRRRASSVKPSKPAPSKPRLPGSGTSCRA